MSYFSASPKGETSTPPQDPNRNPARGLLFSTFTFLATTGLDQLTKQIATTIEGERSIDLLGTFVRFDVVRNPGAGFSLGTEHTWVFTILSTIAIIVVAALLVRTANKASSIEMFLGGLFAGGVTGNLLDRIFRSPEAFQGHVVDFVSIASWPTFNLADTAVVIAALLYLYHSSRQR